jgi:hypothetical protein
MNDQEMRVVWFNVHLETSEYINKSEAFLYKCVIKICYINC